MKMKTLLAPLAFCALALAAQQASAESFNHSWLKRGAVFHNCSHNPCSMSKVVSFQKIRSTPEATTLNIALVDGTKLHGQGYRMVVWDRQPHTVTVVCSKQRPTVISGERETVLPLNSLPVPSILMPETDLYMMVCHSYGGADGPARFGYDVHEY